MNDYLATAKRATGLDDADFEEVSSHISERLQPSEKLGDVIVGSSYLAARRASLLGRPTTREDLAFVLAVFTWWPMKPPPAAPVEERLLSLRPHAFLGLESIPFERWNAGHDLRSLVPEGTLRLDLPDLYERQQRSVDDFLTPPDKSDEVHVLFIEGDADMAQVYRQKLELDGYRVSVATDGGEGVRLAHEDRPDLVFVDVRISYQSGLAVIEALRESRDTNQIPVVVLSNDSKHELDERGLKLGAHEFVIKGETTAAQLSSRVESWIKS